MYANNVLKMKIDKKTVNIISYEKKTYRLESTFINEHCDRLMFILTLIVFSI